MDSRSMTLAEDKELERSTAPSLAPTLGKDPKSDLEDSGTEIEDGSFKEKRAAEAKPEAEPDDHAGE
jgi:hypothetical protein